MPFIPDFEAVARRAMRDIDPSLENQFVTVVKLLALGVAEASKVRGKNAPKVGTKDYILSAAKKFAEGRVPTRPKPPATVPDEMVSFVLEHYFDIPAKSLRRIREEHKLSMGAENIVGDLLERYLAKTMEKAGWVWCSGSLIKAVDFAKPPKSEKENWTLLQVKNRDNSENSAGIAIRSGTTIKKWHRTFSKRPGTNWGAFPDNDLSCRFSEVRFMAFAKDQLHKLKLVPAK